MHVSFRPVFQSDVICELKMDGDGAIAIVGIGCKLPGADNLDEFWRVLVNGENHVKEIDRWSIDAIYDPDPQAHGKTYVRRAGLLDRYV